MDTEASPEAILAALLLLEQRYEATSAGDWVAVSNGIVSMDEPTTSPRLIAQCSSVDAEFIVAAYAMVPLMLDELRRHVVAARTAVPEMGRMLREADAECEEAANIRERDLATIRELVDERDKWRATAQAWEERAQAALRIAEVAAAELKRLKDAPFTSALGGMKDGVS